MKKYLLGIVALCFSTIMIAQVAYQDCANAAMVGNPAYNVLDGTCSNTTTDASFTTIGATSSGFFATETPSCDAGATYTIDAWFQFVAQGDDLNITLSSDNAGSHKVVVYNFPNTVCDASDVTEIACGDVGIDIDEYDVLTIGTTYYVAVITEPGSEDDFTICVTNLAAPSNDDCGTPEVLSSGVAATEVTTIGATNSGSEHTILTPCAAGGSESSVWFSYTPATDEALDVSYQNVSSPGGNPSIAIVENCTDLAALWQSSAYGDFDNVLCLTSGTTYLIQVMNCDAEEGDFSLTLTGNTIAPNDDCANAIQIGTNDPFPSCTMETIAGDQTNSCPESVDYGTCGVFDVEGTVWYTFNTDADAATVDISIDVVTGTNYSFVLLDGASGCASATVVGACYGVGNPMVNESILPNNTYYIIVANTVGTEEGQFNLNVEVSAVIPANDLCAGAATLTEGAGTITGSTICAEPDISSNTDCTLTDYEQTVWYQFTTGANTQKISVNVSAGAVDPAADVAILLLDDNCPPTASQIFESACDFGDNEWCVSPNTIYKILVGTSTLNEGTFEIEFIDITSNIPNDICTGAIPIDPAALVSNCEENTFAGTNVGACNELFTVGGCNFDVLGNAVVWYEFETDADAQFADINLSNLTGGPYNIALYDDNCTNPNAISGCGMAATYLEDIAVTPNTTYHIVIGSASADEGTFDINVTVKNPPENDDCTAGNYVAHTLTDGNTLTTETTNCASPDIKPACSGGTTINTVWYEYTVPAGVKEINIEIANWTSANNVHLAAVDGCNSTTLYQAGAEYCGGEGTELITIDCPTENDIIYFIVGSEDGFDGTFDITLTETAKDPACTANDDCVNAEDLTGSIDPGLFCDWQSFTGYCNLTACPENFTNATCIFEGQPYVWFEVTIPAGVTSMDVRIPAGGADFGDIAFGVFDDFNCATVPTAAAAGTDCVSAPAGEPETNNIAVTAGNTYYILVGAMNSTGGSFDLDIKFTQAPLNDDPCNAGDIPTLTDGTPLTGQTNICASEDLNTGNCDPNQESSVWYTYTIPAGDNGFKLTVTSSGGNGIPVGTDLSMVIVENTGCNAATFEAEECTTEGTEESFTCLDEGTTYAILISTSTANEGDFDISLTALPEDPACIDNDLCANADAVPFAGIQTDDPNGPTCVTDCNKDACPENFNSGACNFNTEEVVWYSVTTDATPDASMNVNVNSGDFNPAIAILELDCNNPTGVTAETLCETGDGSTAILNNIEVMPNTTYLIIVSPVNGEGGTFDLCVEITTSCNDDPCSPVDITGGTVYSDPDNDCTTNIGSTEDFSYDSGDCPDGTVFESSVYFSYQAIPNLSSFEVIFTNAGANGMSNTVGVTVLEYDPANCANAQTTIAGQDCDDVNNIGAVEVICPIADNIYLIQISTAQGDEGDFSIEIIENISSVPNDDCQTAEVLDITDFCEFVEFTGDNTDACPEEFNHPTCTYADGHFVWYQVTIPADVDNMDVQIVGGANVQDPVFAIIETPCGTTPPVAVPGGDCVTATGGTAELLDVPVTAGNTYWILVGSENDREGDFTIRIKMDKPPENDEPCNAEDLSGGGTAALNTTLCAGEDAGFAFGCGPEVQTNSVWFKIVPSDGIDGIEILINNINTSGGVETNVYVANPDGCTGGDLAPVPDNVDCGDLLTEREYSLSCWEDGDVFYIKVSSTSDGAGEFELTVEEKNKSCEYADLCSEITADHTLTPVSPTNENDPPEPACLTSCLDFACPETFGVGGCDFTQTEVVWFQVDVDGGANIMNIVITTGGWTGAVALFDGTSCDDLAQLGNCEMGTPGEILSPGNGINGSQSYWVGVTYESGPLDDPSFDICITTTPAYAECSMQQTITVTARSNDPNGDLGLSLDGPFCPGETISFCYDLDFDPSETNCQWFQGIVPKFGDSWNQTTFDPSSNLPTPGGGWGWYPEGDVLYQEANPFLCTYTNDDGQLNLCHGIFEACTCAPGFPGGTPLPAGWFYYSPGNGAQCTNTGHPNSGWGFPQGCTAVTHFQVCFDIDVKTYETQIECEEEMDLSLTFYPFADGETGCWGDTKCAGDIPERKVYGIICDGLVEVEADTLFEICTGQTTDILLTATSTDAGLQWIVVNEPNDVDGDMDGSTPNYTTTIEQTLYNNDDVVHEVIYQVQAILPNAECPGPKILIKVLVYPELEIEFNDLELCANASGTSDLCASVTGGNGVYVNYEWSTGESGPSNCIAIQPSETTLYCVTVTDELGCMGEECIEVVVSPLIAASLDPFEFELCQSDGGEVVFTPIITGGVPDYTYEWIVSTGIEGEASFDGTEYTVDVENSLNIGSPHIISVTITDAFGCIGFADASLALFDAPNVIVEILEAPCAGSSGDVILSITTIPGINNSPTNIITIYDCDGIQLEQVFSSSANPITVPASSCYTIEAQNVNDCISTVEIDLSTGSVVDPEISGIEEFCFGSGDYTITLDNASEYSSYVWNTGDETSSITITPDSADVYTYSVTVTNNGCTTIGTHVVNVYDPPTINLSGSTSFCIGFSTVIDAGGDPATWTYTWTDPSNNPIVGDTSSLLVMEGGTYNLTVVDDHGCTNSTSIEILESSELSPVIPQQDICDDNTISIDAGPGFTIYEWTIQGDPNIIGTEQTLSVSAPGTYCVNVQDDNGCSGDTCMTVNQHTTPDPTVTPDVIVYNSTDQSSCYTTLNFDDLVSGATGTWENTDLVNVDLTDLTSVDFVGIVKGSYNFTFNTNSAIPPCEDVTRVLTVIVRDCVCPSVDLLVPESLCNNLDTLNLDDNVKNTVEPGIWSINSGPSGQDLNGIIVDDIYFVATAITAGNYEIEFKLSNPVPGCDSTNTVTLTVSNTPVITMSDTIKSCNKSGQSIPAIHNLDDYVNGDSGVWSVFQNPGAVDVSNLPTVDFTDKNLGVYIFRYCTNNAISPCEDVCEFLYINVIDCKCPPTIITDEIVCNSSGQLNLADYITTTTPGTWKNKSGPSNVDVSAGVFDHDGIDAGEYVIFYEYDNPIPGCDSEFEMTITVNNQPFADVSENEEVCGNSPVGTEETKVYLNNLITAGDMTGIWASTDASGIVIPADGILDFELLLGGVGLNMTYTFSYTITGVTPCSDRVYNLEIFVKDCNCNTIITTPFDDMCNEGSDPEVLADHIGSSGPGSWSVDPTIDITSGTFNPNGIEPGIYTLTYTLDVQLPGCPDSSVQTLVVSAPNWAGKGNPISYCQGDNSVINLFDQLTENPDVGGTWSTTSTVPTGFDPILGTFDITGYDSGIYNFEYGFSATGVCTGSSATIVVNIDENPIADAGSPKAIDCDNPTATLDGSTSTNGVNYQWYEGTTLIPGETNATYTVSSAGTYTLIVTNPVTNCMDQDEVIVTASGDFPELIGVFESPSCFGIQDGTISVEASGGAGNYQYQFNNGGFSNTSSWSNLSGGTYTIEVKDDNGCIVPKTFILDAPEKLVVNITPGSHLVEVGTSSVLKIEDGIDLTNMQVTWSIGDSIICTSSTGNCDSIEVETFIPTFYSVEIIDENGCKATDEIKINTHRVYDVYIPGVFNPEHLDGDIKYFYISDNSGIENITLFQIYGRWGELLFDTKDIKPGVPTSGWDGMYKEKLVNPGVYVYLIKVVYDNETEETFTGDITVIR